MPIHKFVRFGTLDLKKQKGYSKNPTSFHQPPTVRGFYAFPIKAVELFLIGGGYGDLTFEQKKELRKEFTHKGNVWHHLGEYCKPVDVQARHGDWVKTTVAIWAKAFSKQAINHRYNLGNISDGFKRITSINEPMRSGPSGIFAKDYLELFFDEKVK